MTIQDQYTSSIRQATQTWAGVTEAFTDNVQKAFGRSGSPFQLVDPNAAIDQVFDFWEQTLEVQRGVAKQVVGVSVAAAEKVRTQAESIGTVVREQGESVTQAVREQGEFVTQAVREHVESVQQEVRDQAVKKYDGLTKPELQDELASRDLPKTGNVHELRERLMADDQK